MFTFFLNNFCGNKNAPILQKYHKRKKKHKFLVRDGTYIEALFEILINFRVPYVFFFFYENNKLK